MATTASDRVAEAKGRIENPSVAQVADGLQHDDALLVDLREPEERETNGTIPGAVYTPRGMPVFWADPTSSYHRSEFDPNRRVILRCSAGSRPALAADTLQQLGYTNAAHLDSGFTAWKKHGQSVEGASSA